MRCDVFTNFLCVFEYIVFDERHTLTLRNCTSVNNLFHVEFYTEHSFRCPRSDWSYSCANNIHRGSGGDFSS